MKLLLAKVRPARAAGDVGGPKMQMRAPVVCGTCEPMCGAAVVARHCQTVWKWICCTMVVVVRSWICGHTSYMTHDKQYGHGPRPRKLSRISALRASSHLCAPAAPPMTPLRTFHISVFCGAVSADTDRTGAVRPPSIDSRPTHPSCNAKSDESGCRFGTPRRVQSIASTIYARTHALTGPRPP